MNGMFFKPGWSPEMLLGYNYLGSLCVIRRAVLEEVGGYRPEYQQAQEWDVLLRLMEADCHFTRVPRCCYLRRTDLGQTPFGIAQGEAATSYRQVLDDYIRRQGLPARAEVHENGTLRIRFSLTSHPLVSVIIPNKNSLNLIRSLVNDLLHKTGYPNMEIIIVDNQSSDPNVHKFYQEQTQAGHIRVVLFNQHFNYSAACNAGSRSARGEYLLFLNNDMEVIAPDWLEDLVGWASLPKTGIVGTKLHYPNGHVQHAGVMIGLFFVSHIWHKLEKAEWGLFGTPDSYRNFLAVTGACQMISRRLFDDLGGYDEQFQLAFSDVMLCLKAWEKGYRIVYSPFASLIHHEGYSRGSNTPIPDFQHFASDFRETGLREDPYFHPGLSVESFDPMLRSDFDLATSENLKQQLDSWDPPADQLTCLDWYNDAIWDDLEQSNILMPPLTYSPPQVATDRAEAAKFILYVLRKNPAIRARFPLALSEGTFGEFCEWLCSEGLTMYRLPKEAAPAIRQVLADPPGAKVRQLFTFREDLRHTFPNALLPTGHKRFLQWLLSAGKEEGHEFEEEELWWFFLELTEDPVAEFFYTYRVGLEWQKNFPNGLTPFGREPLLAWAKKRFHLEESLIEAIRERTDAITRESLQIAYWNKSQWRELFPRAFKEKESTRQLAAFVLGQQGLSPQRIELGADDGKAGLNILGHFCYPSGLQASVKSVAKSLQMLGVPVSLRDVPVNIATDEPDRSKYLDFESHDVTLIHVQPEPLFGICYQRAGLVARGEVYRIGMWYWELETIPENWAQIAEPLEELWAPTEFIAKALENVLPQKITRMLPGVELGPVAPFDRSELGLSKDQYVFLFMFDMKSIMERKNPLGLIAAYEKAFRKDDRVKLVIKVSSGHAMPEEIGRLKEAAKKAGAIVVDEVFPREKAYGLINACDSYVSLHRSEGLGLTMAEAMLLAKPVIATRYSGNLDFMEPSHSLLVDYELQQIEGNSPAYVSKLYQGDAFWANPSIEHAAHAMRWMYEHPEEARSMGLLAKAHAENVLSPLAAGQRLKTRLDEITKDLRGNGALKKAA
jgi:GT2 family glycosyltransferase/glycosyltransferase involved in cell wall biosynthesis